MAVTGGIGFFSRQHEPLSRLDIQTLKALHANCPQGIIFFDENGQGYWPNLSFYNFFQIPPQIPLHLNFFDSLLYNEESWAALSRLKMYSLHRQEGTEIIEFNLRNMIVKVRIYVRTTLGQSMIWFIDPIIPQRQKEGFYFEKTVVPEILELLAYPAIIISADKIVRYTNRAFENWLGREDWGKFLKHPFNRYLEKPPSAWGQVKGKIFSLKDQEGTEQTASLRGAFPLPSQDAACVVLEVIKPQGSIFSYQDAERASFLEHIPMAALLLDHRGYLTAVNSCFQGLVSEKRLIQRPLTQWISEENRSKFTKFLQQVRRHQESEQPFLTSFQGISEKEMGIYAQYLTDTHPSQPGCFFLLLHDMTDLKKLEIQTLESQKLQALGQLAVGITHDFNNLLTAMLGFCDLLLQRHSPQDHSFTDIMQIKQNANRATNLVRQLLLFARQSPPQAKSIDVRECLNELSFLLRRLIGPKIQLTIKHEAESTLIYGDQGQVEQIIMNLAINARDAMLSGGILTIRTRTVQLKEPISLHKNVLKPRHYVVIEVCDTGTGIAAEHLERIFDPFFSTKDPGQGTGLGLATVFQILQKMSGGVGVDTRLHKGTTFSLFIPRYLEKRKKTNDRKDENSPLKIADFTGSAQILLVEDEDPVRLFASRALKSKGYEVFEARDGKRALEILEDNPNLDLLITDVIMPGIDGPTLVNLAFGVNPDMKILFVSGYPEEELQAKINSPFSTLYFLSKPFNLNELAAKVHEVLGVPTSPPEEKTKFLL